MEQHSYTSEMFSPSLSSSFLLEHEKSPQLSPAFAEASVELMSFYSQMFKLKHRNKKHIR